MITHLHVQNYKCLRDVQIDLAPFTILIGPNDSGKSSLLDVVQRFGKLATQPIPEAFSNDLQYLIWRKESKNNFLFAVEWATTEGLYSWQTSLSPTQGLLDESLTRGSETLLSLVEQNGRRVIIAHWPSPLNFGVGVGSGSTGFSTLVRQSSPPHSRLFATIAASLISTSKYSLDPDALRRPCQLQPNAVLTSRGDNLVAVLDLIVGAPDPSVRFELERIIQAEIPSLRGVYLPALDNGQKSLEFTLAGNGRSFVTIPAAFASEGALLLTAFLALAYGNTPDILLIEEPENGLHPSRLKHVVELLRKISSGTIGNRPRQVIITTHSPILLNFAKPEEIRILSPDSERGTQVVPLTNVRDIDKLLKEFAIGELWYMLGEEALLKETPA